LKPGATTAVKEEKERIICTRRIRDDVLYVKTGEKKPE